ncbi:S-norcoclaurine synthase 1-like [Cryptomeria japonica]|uniref:S-norcoclaurine synthase 1-like n=1 Tax=Cryptomeria japonica TaxID=3369 RepID=UPI0027D9D134|nr:S-norcoclaurine synthase 1-like [Cryptomeria japonica]
MEEGIKRLASFDDTLGICVSIYHDYEGILKDICKDGEWVPVQPIPGALVINIGDMLEVISNGIYKSIEHRGVTSIDRDRISIAMFFGPSKETEVGPIPELIDELHPCRYRRFIREDYMRRFSSGKLDGKKNIEFVKIES